MKRYICLIAAVLFSVTLSAQSRAVIKHLAEGDCTKAKEKFDKIETKDIEKAPDLYALASSMWSNAECNPLRRPLVAYETFSRAYDQLVTSEDIAKALKHAKLTFADIKRQFEQGSVAEVYKIDRVDTYESYIPLAERAEHTDLVEIKRRYELCCYNVAVAQNTIKGYTTFLSKFPVSEYKEEVTARRTDLYFGVAMASQVEAEVEEFLLSYPEYKRIAEVKAHLSDLQFERVIKENRLNDLGWFAQQYPDYPRLGEVWQAMADIEYSVLDNNDIEALRSFTQRYPTVTQTPQLLRKVQIADMINACDVKAMFDYIRTNGYDRNYSRFVRAIAKTQGRLILTPDIRKVDMVRFRSGEGKIGYMDFEGNVKIEPTYEAGNTLLAWGEESSMPLEFKRGRCVTAVCVNGKWGAIYITGEVVVKPTYESIGFFEDRISCVVRSTDDGEVSKTYCNEFDFTGKLIKSNRLYEAYCEAGEGEIWWGEGWFNQGVRVTKRDDYNGVLYDAQQNVVGYPYCGFRYASDNFLCYTNENYSRSYFTSRNAEVFWATVSSISVTKVAGDVIFALKNEGEGGLLLDLANRKVLSDQYGNVDAMNDERAMVRGANDRYGYLDAEMNVVIPIEYRTAYSFKYGVAAVADDRGAYLIDTDGVRVSATYDKVTPMWEFDGLYYAENNGLIGVIDSNGDEVLPVQYANGNGILGIIPVSDGAVSFSPSEKVVLYGL